MQPQFYQQNGRLTIAKTGNKKCGVCHRFIDRGATQYETSTYDRSHRTCAESPSPSPTKTTLATASAPAQLPAAQMSHASDNIYQTIAHQITSSDPAIQSFGYLLRECLHLDESWLTEEITSNIPQNLSANTITSHVASDAA